MPCAAAEYTLDPPKPDLVHTYFFALLQATIIVKVRVQTDNILRDLNKIRDQSQNPAVHTLADNIQETLEEGKAIDTQKACDRIEHELANVQSKAKYKRVLNMIKEARNKYGRHGQFVRLQSKTNTLKLLACS